jgi:hypothetical protein
MPDTDSNTTDGRSRLPAIPVFTAAICVLYNLRWVAHEGGVFGFLLFLPVLGIIFSAVIGIRGTRGNVWAWVAGCALVALISSSSIILAIMMGGGSLRTH